MLITNAIISLDNYIWYAVQHPVKVYTMHSIIW